MTPPSWASVLPATGPAWGLVCVTDTARITLNDQSITLYKLSDGSVKVDADNLPALRSLMGTSS